MAFAFGSFAFGCAPPPLYNWGRYEDSLQASYAAQDEAKVWSDLEVTINPAKGGRIPPGACAEYGFLLYKRGQRDRAIEYFQQEARMFPESKALMDRLIAKVREQLDAAVQAPAAGGSVQ
jgi:hypothetical protein